MSAADASAATDLVVGPSGRPLDANVRVPGDKSIAHRAAMFAGLADGTSVLHGFPDGADNRATLSMMQAWGAAVRDRGESPGGGRHLELDGVAMQAPAGGGEPIEVDAQNSGTTTRLGMGIAAGLDACTVFRGDASLSRRPMRRVTEHLIAMGADVRAEGHGSDDHLPLGVVGGRLRDYRTQTAKASAQVKSAILLAGLVGRAKVEVREPALSRDHTERFVQFLFPDERPLVQQGTAVALVRRDLAIPPFSAQVPGDPSSAAFWAAIAVVGGGEVVLPGLCWNPTRTGFFAALTAMGAEVVATPSAATASEPICDVVVRGRLQRGTTVAGDAVVAAIDELPLLALLGLFLPAGEAVTIRDAGELRVKESDRVETTAAVARAFGGDVATSPDGLSVAPPTGGCRAAAVDSHGDHRIAMGAAVCALGAGVPVTIRDAGAAAVSYPAFWQQLETLGLATIEAADRPA